MIVRQSIGLTSTGENQISWTKNIVRAISGNISFGSSTDNTDLSRNIDGVWAVVANTGTADTQFTVNHSLGRVPIGFDTKRNNTSGVVYDSGTPWTDTQIFLKCSAANAAVTLFLH